MGGCSGGPPAGSATRVGFQDVRQVDVADQVGSARWVIGRSDGEAGVAGGGDELLDARGSDIRFDGDQSLQRQSNYLGLGLFKGQRSG